MEYDFRKIEQEWQEKWKANKVYKVSDDLSRPKCYVLDMFPYPSGAGLHVGPFELGVAGSLRSKSRGTDYGAMVSLISIH